MQQVGWDKSSAAARWISDSNWGRSRVCPADECLAPLGYRSQAWTLVLGFQPEASLLRCCWPPEYLLNLSDRWPLRTDQDAYHITCHSGRFSTIKKFRFISWLALGCLLAAFSLTLYSKTLMWPRVRHFISHFYFSLKVLLSFIRYSISHFLKYTWRVSHWWSKTQISRHW